MKRAFQIIRLVVEALAGLLVLLVTLVSIRQTLAVHTAKAILAGSMAVYAIVLALGVFLLWDAIKLFKRLRTPTAA